MNKKDGILTRAKKKECGPTNSFDLSSTDLQDNKLKLQETANTQKIMMSFTENNMRWCRLAQDIQIQNFHLITNLTVLQEETSLVAQMVKRLPTMQETRVQSLGQKAILEEEMATHSSILAWKIPWMEEPGSKESDKTEQLHFHYHS